ncbi:MAG: pyruvate dehydrogenase (acetyl-transferring) E1 component subunit alpha [Chlamydiales bacterium]|nr:pyruvate dehydrogenase (acetyl-transferring) E1 component subunit alpha [Chlamydiales bacterium]
MKQPINYHFFHADEKRVIKELGKDRLLEALRNMLLIRNFDIRGESAYKQGKVGGFYHAYIGQEAIQTGCVSALGTKPWYTTTYRCHALALLTGVTPNEAMAELYGKATGNAKGRGGSMHFFSDRMLGGYGIVGGHIPLATGAAFSLKYQNQEGISICFFGDGASVQGSLHESLNLASLWDLPALYVVENNQWGMGTDVERAVCVQPIAEHFAKAYDMESYTVDGMNFFDCYQLFKELNEKIQKTNRPILIEAVSERFRGHSISDPALYRAKEHLEEVMKKDPILFLKTVLIKEKMITEEAFEKMNEQQKDMVIASMKFAEESPLPELATLEEDVFAP